MEKKIERPEAVKKPFDKPKCIKKLRDQVKPSVPPRYWWTEMMPN